VGRETWSAASESGLSRGAYIVGLPLPGLPLLSPPLPLSSSSYRRLGCRVSVVVRGRWRRGSMVRGVEVSEVDAVERSLKSIKAEREFSGRVKGTRR
jgi:hypothetical protein